MRYHHEQALVKQVTDWGFAAFTWSGALCLLALAVFIIISAWRGDE